MLRIARIQLLVTLGTLAVASACFLPERVHAPVESRRKPVHMVFVGDIMLGRMVETLSRERGWNYPFSGISSLIAGVDVVYGNFEGTVLEVHVPTPYNGFQFSFPKEAAAALAEAGFTHVSLGNNHGYDLGAQGFAATRTYLQAQGVVPFGTPVAVSRELSIYQGVVLDQQLKFFSYNVTYPTVSEEAMLALVREEVTEMGYNIVFVHWGEEYASKANAQQRRLARLFIDAGADAVIGHHPHVVQDIEMYNQKPIFYSLGNFIFDQYFSSEVQQGLALRLTLHNEAAVYTLMPISIQQSVPGVMHADDARMFLDQLAVRSDPAMGTAIIQGVLEIER